VAPFDLSGWTAHAINLLIGIAFGFVLESTGFGDSRRLAAQFYFRELRVVQTMFTAIITAMFLLLITSGLGWLDFSRLWINPTYLPSVTLGGIIFGIGFAIGGYCPGTSLVSAATLKIDGLLFVVGSMAGMWLFGETADRFRAFYEAGYQGPLMITELFDVSIELAALLVALLALVFFGGLKLVSRLLGYEKPVRWGVAAAGTSLIFATLGLVAWIGQPSVAEKWQHLESTYGDKLAKREVHIAPPELVSLQGDPYLQLEVLDVRSEADWNQFHLTYSRRVDIEALPQERTHLLGLADPSAVVVLSNDEGKATTAWQRLATLGIPNIYILAGGINRWIETYLEHAVHQAQTHEDVAPGEIAASRNLVQGRATSQPATSASQGATCAVVPLDSADSREDRLRWRFEGALGGRQPASYVDPGYAPELDYEPKVKLERKERKSGGCG
jgi:rhodanese-related sulfurtransferase/uncharacterized membrane protein (DUF485 family)